MRTRTITIISATIGAMFILASAAQATTFVSGRGGNGNERCLVGADSLGQSGGIGQACTGGGQFEGQSSIVDLIIDDIGGGLSWERVDDPLDSFLSFMSGSQTTQVQGRARYAGYNTRFGATLQNGDYHELIGALPSGKILLTDCTGISGCDTTSSNFTALDDVIAGLAPGNPWKPTIDVNGLGTTFYTSLAADNYANLDHLVVFKTVDAINDPQQDGFNAYRYILGFEDLRSLGDQDYNDYVVEVVFSSVTTVTEPGAFALLGIGLLGVAGLRRRTPS